MSLDIGKLFHVVHASEELGPLDAWYDRVFAPRRGIMDGDFLARDLRDGSLVAIGDAIVETMAPAARPGAAASPIGRFVGRFGRHLHSLAWYTEDVGAIWERLTGHGIRVVATFAPEGGRPPEGDIYAHPKDAITQLEFFQPPRSGGGPTAPGPIPDPRFAPGWPAEWESRENPLGVEALAYTTVVTDDLAHAEHVFCEVLEGTVLDRQDPGLTGTESTFVAVGPETVVELARPADATSLASADLEVSGPGCHAMAWRVADLARAEAHLGACGIPVVARDDRTLLTDPADTFGAVLRFTTLTVPGDPRQAAA